MKRAMLWLVWVVLAVVLGGSTGCQSGPQNIQGVREFNAGRYDAAAERFRLVTLDSPGNADAYYNLASTMHQMAFLKSRQARSKEEDDEVRDLQIQAESLYNRCLDKNENHVECHRGLAVLLVEMGRSEQAFTLLKGWTANNPEVADARIELARLYEEHGDLDTAELHLHQAMQMGNVNSRSHSRAWAAAGLIRERNGDLVQAEQNFRRAYNLNRDQPGVGVHLASLNQRMLSDVFDSRKSDTRLVREGGGRRRY